jgi:DNA-binding NtrC family response regulator
MPAQIALVHDEDPFRDLVARTLRDARYNVAEYPDALAATDVLDNAGGLELLITRVTFAEGRSNGAALARMVRFRRPFVRVIFIARLQMQQYVDELGVFLPVPVAMPDLLAAVRQEIGVPPNEGGWPFEAL